jgi:hypothetical protein
MKASGASQNTSILVEVMPNFKGVSQPLPAGSPNKNGVPAMCRAATDPRLHSSTAPSARLYHPTAIGTSEIASITDSTGGLFSADASPAMLVLLIQPCSEPPRRTVGLGYRHRVARCN